MTITTRVIDGETSVAIEEAVAVLQRGGLIAFPTDTVYGLAARYDDDEAVAKIYQVKGRSSGQPIALLLSDARHVTTVADFPARAAPLVRRFWPGGLTLILTKTAAVSDVITPLDTVGVRVPNLRLALGLIEAAGGILAVTSANRSGQPAPVDADGVVAQLDGRIELVLDGGRCWGTVPSTVLDCTRWPPVVLRHGAVPFEAIQNVLERAGDA